MLVRSFRGAGVAVFLASLMWAQAGPDGHWEGTLKVDNREVGLSLDLAKNEKAEWTASMGVPSENATGLVVKDLAIVHFQGPFPMTIGTCLRPHQRRQEYRHARATKRPNQHDVRSDAGRRMQES